MNAGFWSYLPPDFIGLSPMDGVTDYPFRTIAKKYGHPDVMYTEFTSVEGVCHGAEKLLTDFLYDETHRPLVAQIYGTTPDFFHQTAIVLCQLGFDGIDINMGCPAKNVSHAGAGAALILTPSLAAEIVQATKQGVVEWTNGATVRDCSSISTAITTEVERRANTLRHTSRDNIPVSIKTRIGYAAPVVHEWISHLLSLEPAALAIHGRTLKQHYSGQADWEQIGQAAALARGSKTRMIGNGDVHSAAEGKQKAQMYGLSGVLLGRATLGNPTVLSLHPLTPPHPQLLEIALEHARLFEATYAHHPKYSFLPMRKHLGWYIRGMAGAKELRQAAFATNSATEFTDVLAAFTQENGILAHSFGSEMVN